jgi:hypothetical protein
MIFFRPNRRGCRLGCGHVQADSNDRGSWAASLTCSVTGPWFLSREHFRGACTCLAPPQVPGLLTVVA